jgi:hypothetical protein
MRTLFVGALPATVVGCSCYAPAQASIGACTAGGLACLGRSSFNQTIEPEPAVRDAGLSATKTRPKIATITEKPPFARARHKTGLAMTTTKFVTPTANVEPAAAKVEPVLTPREQHVLASPKLGLPTNLSVVRLNFFENTMEMHAQHIMRKMLLWN